jgi:type VI secretion system protein
MHNERTILERLRKPEEITRRSVRLDRHAILDSVVRNLRQILNARQGSALAQMDLGIPAPCEIVLGFPEAVGQLKRTIVNVIEKYEPRLHHVQVFYQPKEAEGLVINFIVSGRLVHDNTQISFETHFDNAGLIHLEA